jgi:hypothetical protein
MKKPFQIVEIEEFHLPGSSGRDGRDEPGCLASNGRRFGGHGRHQHKTRTHAKADLVGRIVEWMASVHSRYCNGRNYVTITDELLSALQGANYGVAHL